MPATPRASTRARAWSSAPASPAFPSRTIRAIPGAPFYSLNESVERLRAARSAIDESGERVLLTARSECVWVRDGGGLPEALRRLEAFTEAGADVLFAPGVRTREDIAAVVRVAGKLPVNVVVGAPGLTPAELEDLGVKRISTGAALARAAWGGFMRAARDIAEHGRFDALTGLAPAQGDRRGVRGEGLRAVQQAPLISRDLPWTWPVRSWPGLIGSRGDTQPPKGAIWRAKKSRSTASPRLI